MVANVITASVADNGSVIDTRTTRSVEESDVVSGADEEARESEDKGQNP